jgi:hypothetical protein
MRRRRRPLPGLVLLAVLLALPAPAAAAQRHAEPLVDLAPAPGARVVDRVLDRPPQALRARAAQAAGRTAVLRASDGLPVRVTMASAYAADTMVAQSYVDLVSGLPHGSELGLLRMRIVPPQQVAPECGATEDLGVIACYLPPRNLMVVPGEQSEVGVTPAYVVAHEYGHHVANHRSNPPFGALDYGPKQWASLKNVCHEALAGRLAPGDEGDLYRANPGEAWAETYARLKYPEGDGEWRYSDLLRPTQAGNFAAAADVLHPWKRSRRQTFRGRLGPFDAQDRFTFRLTLDGSLRFRLAGPRAANYDLEVRADGHLEGRTRMPGSRDRLGWEAACVQAPETIAATVRRRSGSGPYTLRVTSAG